MAFLRRIAESFSGIFRSTPNTQQIAVIPARKMDPETLATFDSMSLSTLEPKVVYRKPPDEAHIYDSYSILDVFMARAINRAAQEMFDDGQGAIEPAWDVDMTDVIESIEVDGQSHHMSTETPPLSTSHHSDDSDSDSISSVSRAAPRRRFIRTLFPSEERDTETGNESVDIKSKYDSQINQCKDMIEQGWEEDTILAYLKLDRRGFEALFPLNWQIDFMLFPEILFTEANESAFIRAVSPKKCWRAMKEFDVFCRMGQDVRTSLLGHTHFSRRPEALLNNAIKQYITWTYQDAHLAEELRFGRVPQLMTVLCARHTTTSHPHRAEMLQEQMHRRLRRMGDRLLDTLKFAAPSLDSGGHGSQYLINPPTIFGFVVVDSLVGVVAYEAISGTSRTIGFYDFDDRHVEVMNSISLAIVIHWVKYGMIRLKEALEEQGGVEMSPTSDDESEESDRVMDVQIWSKEEDMDTDDPDA